MAAKDHQSLNNKRIIEQYDTLAAEIQEHWVKANTAVLVIHGIGHQNPLETLDGFARGLVESYPNAQKVLELEHRLAKKTASDRSTPWFDNILRIKKKGESYFIDVYEYYWAHETEGLASFKDLQTWLHKVTDGAKKFYKENEYFAVQNGDDSPFMTKQKFSSFKYHFFVSVVPQVLVLIQWISSGIYSLLSGIPILGSMLSKMAESSVGRYFNSISNVLNDVTIYNTTDAKSNFFKIRNCILTGAVDSLRFLLEAHEDEHGGLMFKYDRVLLAGHSLGSQVAFDAINRLNHLVNQGEIKGYSTDGGCSATGTSSLNINQRLIGLVTFGSPLDKIAFFFREQAPKDEYIRKQILSSFHCFKQRQWLTRQEKENTFTITHNQNRLFEEIGWFNYWDDRDYVSGSLDYYALVTNINCGFKSSSFSFTHSKYWACNAMYAEIYRYFLLGSMVDAPEEVVNQMSNA